MDVSVTQWSQVKSIIERALPAKLISGRPRQDDQQIRNAILWICRTGSPWKDMPDRSASYQTCHRRFQEWVKQGV